MSRNVEISHIRHLLSQLPAELVNELIKEFRELRRRFLLRDWAPSELNGGRFAEVTLRILEWKMSGSYTPIGATMNRTRIISRVTNDASLPGGLRFHIRRCADLVFDVRNQRDVAHLGANIEVSRMDSELVLRLCSWILAELVREFGQADPETAQSLIDKISVEQLPWIEEINGEIIVLETGLSATQRTLLALHNAHPSSILIPVLRKSVGYTNYSRFKTTILSDLAENRKVHIQNDAVTITSKGISEIEATISDLRAQK